MDESTRREPLRFEYEKAQKSHSTGVIDKNSSTTVTSEKKKAKQMKSYRKKEVLESRAKYNRKKRNKIVVEELQVVKTVGMSTRNKSGSMNILEFELLVKQVNVTCQFDNAVLS